MVVDAVLAEGTMVPRGGRRATACQIPPRMDSCRCAVAAEAAGCSRGRDQDDDFEPGRSSPARACAGGGRTGVAGLRRGRRRAEERRVGEEGVSKVRLRWVAVN